MKKNVCLLLLIGVELLHSESLRFQESIAQTIENYPDVKTENYGKIFKAHNYGL